MSSQAQTWDQAATTYDAERSHNALYHRCVQAAQHAIEASRPTRVLDIGCGTGLTTVPLCRPGRTVIAADYSLASLRVLHDKRVVQAISQADVTQLPFADRAFNAVLCANTLQHLNPEAQRAAVTELRRVCTGTVVLTVHHYSREKAQHGWIKEGRPGQPGIDYIFRFTRDELRALLPGCDVQAIGLSLGRGRLEPYLPQWAKRRLAIRGDGHMLLAIAH